MLFLSLLKVLAVVQDFWSLFGPFDFVFLSYWIFFIHLRNDAMRFTRYCNKSHWSKPCTPGEHQNSW